MNVRATVDSTTTSVGGRLHLTLEVEDAQGTQVAPPPPGTDTGPFLLRSAAPREGAAIPTFDLALVATRPGELSIPPIQLPARTAAGTDTTLASPPVSIEVRSNLAPPEAVSDSAAALAPLAEYKPPLEAPRDWRPVFIALGAFAIAAVLGYLLLRRLRSMRRRVSAPVANPLPKKALRPAWEIALEELDRIAREDYVARGELKLQYVEVTEALRRYLEDRYGVPALESTTDELRARLEETSLRADARSRVLSLLSEADLVKFAKARPEAAAARSTLTRAREVVLETAPAGGGA